MNNAESLDELFSKHRWCYYIPRDGFIEGKGFRVSVVFEGINGHYPTGDLDGDIATRREPWFWGMDYGDAEQTCAEQNQKLGLDVTDVWKIVSSSMFRKAQ